MKYLYFLTFMLLCYHDAFSQSDLRSGYIIKNNGDTIHGLIAYKGSLVSSKQCVFEENEKSNSKVYFPEDIKAYRIDNGKYYVSKSYTIDDVFKPVFMEYLIDGIADIYYLRDEDGEHYFIEQDNEMHELKNEEKEVLMDGKKYIMDSKEYIGMLKYFFKESPKAARKAELTKLSHASLIKITQEYHNEVCTDYECIVFEKDLPTITHKIGLMAGINVFTIALISDFSDDKYFMKNSDFGINIYPTIGVFYHRNMPYLNENLSFQVEIGYSQQKLQTFNTYFEPVYKMTYLNDIVYSSKSINNSIFLKYSFAKNKFSPYLQFGGFYNQTISASYSQNLEIKYSSGDTYITEELDSDPFLRYNLGFCTGIGIKTHILKKKVLFMDLKYQRGIGLMTELHSNNIIFSIGI